LQFSSSGFSSIAKNVNWFFAEENEQLFGFFPLSKTFFLRGQISIDEKAFWLWAVQDRPFSAACSGVASVA
jgi:hypothetical protein